MSTTTLTQDSDARARARLLAAAVCLTAMGLSACGGGGGGSSTPSPVVVTPPPPPLPPPPPPPPVGPAWTPGVFAAASTFKDRCEIPRTGNDLNGRPFPDRAGTALEERFWLRSWTQETYLWNTEVTDQNPASFSTRTAYFAVLKTTAKTPSAKDKDDFHFNESTEAYQRRQQSAPSSTYGADFVFKASSPPRDVRVGYTEPLSPAAAVTGGQAALVRGSRLLRINGIDLVNANTQDDVNRLNAALFPSAAGTSTTFVVRDPGATADRTVTLTSINLSPSPVNRTRVIDTPTGKVGYILFNTFSPFESERAIVQAITEMRINSVTDLVLDPDREPRVLAVALQRRSGRHQPGDGTGQQPDAVLQPDHRLRGHPLAQHRPADAHDQSRLRVDHGRHLQRKRGGDQRAARYQLRGQRHRRDDLRQALRLLPARQLR